MPYLVHKDKDGSVIQFWNLHEGVMTVGRADEVNAHVDDPKLSRKHFEITPAARRRRACSLSRTWAPRTARSSMGPAWPRKSWRRTTMSGRAIRHFSLSMG